MRKGVYKGKRREEEVSEEKGKREDWENEAVYVGKKGW